MNSLKVNGTNIETYLEKAKKELDSKGITDRALQQLDDTLDHMKKSLDDYFKVGRFISQYVVKEKTPYKVSQKQINEKISKSYNLLNTIKINEDKISPLRYASSCYQLGGLIKKFKIKHEGNDNWAQEAERFYFEAFNKVVDISKGKFSDKYPNNGNGNLVTMKNNIKIKAGQKFYDTITNYIEQGKKKEEILGLLKGDLIKK